MSFIEVDENIFDSPSQTLVNTVNTVGVMGAGIALQFKRKVPGMFAAYRELFEKGELLPDRLHVYTWGEKQIVLFPTKVHWRDDSVLDMVTANLRLLASSYEALGITSLAIPPVGCGYGRLDYLLDIRPLMVELFEPLPIEVRCVFGGTAKVHCQ